MLKTSAHRRAQVAASKKRHGSYYDANARAYHREYGRAHANELNEVKRARRHRHGKNRNSKAEKAARIEMFGNLRIVTSAWLTIDSTRYRGPGWLKEARLEAQADAILYPDKRRARAAERRTPVSKIALDTAAKP